MASLTPTEREHYGSLLTTVRGILVARLEHEGIEHLVEMRLKSLESIDEKIRRKGYREATDEMTDIAGLRIITASLDDVVSVEKSIRSEFNVDDSKSRDHAASLRPSEFGYSAAHFVVRLNSARAAQVEHHAYAPLVAEIQVRTVFQDAWAKASHFLLYKNSGPEPIQRRLNALAGLSEVGDRELTALRTFMQEGVERASDAVRQDEVVPLTPESMSAYASSSSRIESWKNVLDQLGVVLTTKSHQLEMAFRLAERFDLATTADLDGALDEATAWGRDFFQLWIEAINDGAPDLPDDFFLSAVDILIFLLVAGHLESMSEDILVREFSWRAAPTKVLLDAAREARGFQPAD